MGETDRDWDSVPLKILSRSSKSSLVPLKISFRSVPSRLGSRCTNPARALSCSPNLSTYRPHNRVPAPMWPVPRTHGMGEFQQSPYMDYSDNVPGGDYVSFDAKTDTETLPPPPEKVEKAFQV